MSLSSVNKLPYTTITLVNGRNERVVIIEKDACTPLPIGRSVVLRFDPHAQPDESPFLVKIPGSTFSEDSLGDPSNQGQTPLRHEGSIQPLDSQVGSATMPNGTE